jgi:rhamnosyltransferase subunit B
MARILMCSAGDFGDFGDLAPLLGIGRALRSRGHEVMVGATERLQSAIAEAGLQFMPVATEVAQGPLEFRRQWLDDKIIGTSTLQDLYLPAMTAGAPDFDDIVSRRQIDLVATHPLQLAGPIVAQRWGLPWITINTSPRGWPTRFEVPPDVPNLEPLAHLPRPLAHHLCRLSWTATLAATRRLLDDRGLNELRATWGLPPERNLRMLGGLSPTLVLYCTSEVCFPRPADWPAHMVCTGYVGWDRSQVQGVPDDLARWLQERPYIVSTLGTWVSNDPQTFFEMSQQVARRLGVRALVLTNRAGTRRIDNDVAVWDFVPLSLVLPAARAVLHHGGHGTALAALRWGCPAVIIPRMAPGDFYARRVVRLGAGVKLRWSRLSVACVESALRTVLEDRPIRAASAAIARSMAAEDGAEVGAGRIAELVG